MAETRQRRRKTDTAQLIAYLLIVGIALIGYAQIDSTKDEVLRQAEKTESVNKGLEQNVVNLREQVRSLGGVPTAPGPAGTPGLNGLPGFLGRDGRDGSNGRDGAAGPTGDPGVVGAPGSNGAAGNAGKDGAQGEQGTPGAQGDPGLEGRQGEPGPAGSPAPTEFECIPKPDEPGVFVCRPKPSFEPHPSPS